MKKTCYALGALVSISWSSAGCTNNVGNCKLDPMADCYIGNPGGATTTTTTTSSMGGNMTTSSSSTNGGGGSSTGGSSSTNGPCEKEADCGSGFCVDGFCCNMKCDGVCFSCATELTGKANGTCAPIEVGKDRVETPFCANKGGCGVVVGWCRCQDGELNEDETDVDCGGSCGATCTTGQGCSTDADCKNQTTCVENICCNGPCPGPCSKCNLANLSGLCSPVFGQIDGCSGDCSIDGCEASLGSDCSLLSVSVCSTEYCGLVEGAYVCAKCNTDANCPTGRACVDGYCIKNHLPKGAFCTSSGQCNTQHCVDGVCCENACGGKCMACSVNYTTIAANGSCAPVTEGYDPQNECDGPGTAATCDGKGSCGIDQ